MKIEELLPDSYRKTAELATQFIIEHPEFIKILIPEIDNQKPVIAMRISRIIALCNDQNPELITPFTEALLDILLSTKNNSVIRNILYIFQNKWKELNEEKLGLLLDECFKYLENATAEPAHRMYSMKIIYATSVLYPEIKNELSSIIEFHYEEGSAGFKSSCRNILKQIKK